MGLFHAIFVRHPVNVPFSGIGAKAQRMMSHANCAVLGEMKGWGTAGGLWASSAAPEITTLW